MWSKLLWDCKEKLWSFKRKNSLRVFLCSLPWTSVGCKGGGEVLSQVEWMQFQGAGDF